MRYAVLIVLLSLCSAGFGQGLPNYDAKSEVMNQVFDFAMEKYGARWRVGAVLRSCGNIGIADAIRAKDESEIIVKEMARIVYSKEGDEKYAGLREEGPEAIAYMANFVLDFGKTYSMGYEDAIESFENFESDKYQINCEAAVKAANEILQKAEMAQ